jgi:hypothetical protein
MITYESMAMAAGEDDADKFKSGGVLTCSASVQDSGEDRCKTAVRIALQIPVAPTM